MAGLKAAPSSGNLGSNAPPGMKTIKDIYFDPVQGKMIVVYTGE